MKTKKETFAQLSQQLMSLLNDVHATVENIEELGQYVTAITARWKADQYTKRVEQTFEADPVAIVEPAPQLQSEVVPLAPAIEEPEPVASPKPTMRKTLKPALNMTKEKFIGYCEKHLGPILDKELKKVGPTYLDSPISGYRLYTMLPNLIKRSVTYNHRLHLSKDNQIDSKVWYTWLEEVHRNWQKKRANTSIKTQYIFTVKTGNSGKSDQLVDYLKSHHDAEYVVSEDTITAKSFRAKYGCWEIKFISMIPAEKLLEHFWAFDLEDCIKDNNEKYLLK